MTPPTGDLREDVRVRGAAQNLKAWLDDYETTVESDGHGPLGDCWSVGFPDAPEGLELGWLRTFAALASQPVETKGPWIARCGNESVTEGWWVHSQRNTHPRRWYGPFTEPQARGVADKLNELEAE